VDLSLPIGYNSLSCNTVVRQAGGVPSSGYLTSRVEIGDIEVAAFAEKRALKDGIDASDVYLGRRRINAIITAYGSTKGDFWDKQQALLAAFSPTLAYNADSANLGFLPLDFFQPTADIATWPTSAYPSGIPMRFYVRPSVPPAFTVDRDQTGGVAGGGLSLPYRVSLVARDPRKFLQTETTIAIASGTSTSASNAADYVGDYPTDLATVTIISAAATGSVVYRIEGSSFTISLDAASTTYTLDLKERTFKKSGTLNMGLITVGGWPQLGLDATVNIFRDDNNAASSASLTFRQAFA
jgi:hypothetical protein